MGHTSGGQTKYAIPGMLPLQHPPKPTPVMQQPGGVWASTYSRRRDDQTFHTLLAILGRYLAK